MATPTLDFPNLKIEYPESDGKPMAETDVHRKLLMDTIAALIDFFRNVIDVYVAGNLLFYYEEGVPSSAMAPDVFVVKGVMKGNRRTYRLWEEKHVPCTVFEFTSRSTRLEDMGVKREIYAMLGVKEYFICDPLAEYLEPPLQGFVLERGDYVRLKPESDGSFLSRELGLKLMIEENNLRLMDVKTGEKLLTPAEAQEKARREAKARQAEAEARKKAESEVEKLRAELAKLRGEK
ncbi:MAG: Uma2 family endonuclease [Chloroflexi bacterium]|nr:Uma2 family endonuclease [Chloroflexota bacterium]